MTQRHIGFVAVSLALALAALACGGSGANPAGGEGGLSGMVTVDGSSTVFPVTEAVAEEFQRVQSGVRVTVGVSGTGGGFKKFCTGETDISDASRPIKDEEAAACAEAGIEYIELGVAIDALAVVVNADNDWLRGDCMTVEQLRAAWSSGSTVRTWRDIDPTWPDEQIRFYAPGHDSGTFDYFTEVINGESGDSRTENVLFSEDDNVLVQGVAGERHGLGYFGFAYFEENRDALKSLAIDDGEGCVEPTVDNVEADRYKPLARPIFIYVSTASIRRPEVAAFVEFYMENVNDLLPDIGYMSLPTATFERYRSALHEAGG